VSFWNTLFVTLGGEATLLAVLALMGKSYLSMKLNKEIKRYESELKTATDDKIERLKNDLLRSVESYKLQLRKSEFLFAREYDAEKELVRIVTITLPLPSRPGMEIDDAYEDMLDRMDETEKLLLAFRTNHGSALDDEERQLLHEAISLANEGRFFEAYGADPKQGRDIAESLWLALKKLESHLLRRFRDQVGL
jgi:plasmid stability protein